jgi:UDPglucose 6-dehydrogenase
VESDRAKKLMEQLYKPFMMNSYRLIFTDIPSSEMIKYAANSMLATRISFMNEIANLCELVGADVNMIRKGIGSDPRIGSKFIYPGAGYGGSCFPKDVKAIIKTANDKGYSLEILKSVERVNNRQKLMVFQKLARHFDGQLKGKKVAIWGLSFKPNTNDMREAPSLVVIEKLIEFGVNVSAYDPVAATESKKYYSRNLIHYANSPYDALNNADALILMTEWNEFRILNIKEMKKRMNDFVIIDGRNIYDASELKNNGFSYYGIGQ